MPSPPRDRLSEVQAATRQVLRNAATADPPLRPRSWRVLAAVLSLTSTWTRLEDATSHGQLGELCGLDRPSDRRNLSRELRDLAGRGLIVYRPGSSQAGERRTASVVGIPRPPVGADHRSDTQTPGRDRPPVSGDDPRSDPAPTPGRTRHGPPVGADHPSLQVFPTGPPSANGANGTDHASDDQPRAGGGDEDQGPHFWDDVVGRLPHKTRRRIEAAPPAVRARLRGQLGAAATAGLTPSKVRALVDQPTALDADGIKDPAGVLAARIAKHLTPAAAGTHLVDHSTRAEES